MPPVETLEKELEAQTPTTPEAAIVNKGTEVGEGDDILAMVQEAETGETTPSIGAIPESSVGNNWNAEARVANHGTTPEAPAEAVVTPATGEATITPIATGLTEAPASEIPDTPANTESTIMDSAFTAPAVETDTALPASMIADSDRILKQDLPNEAAKIQANFDEKVLGEKPAQAEAPEPIVESDDPEERLNSHRASAKEIFEKMKTDLQDINEELDRSLREAENRLTERLAEAKVLEDEAKALKDESDQKATEAYQIRTTAQNELDIAKGKIEGRKAEVSDQITKLEALAV